MRRKFTSIIGICTFIVIVLLSIALYRNAVHNRMPIMRDPPPPAKIGYHSWAAAKCGNACEWRDSVGDNIWTLVKEHRVVARVFLSSAYPGYWDVSTTYGARGQESQWGTLDSAKDHVEQLANNKPYSIP